MATSPIDRFRIRQVWKLLRRAACELNRLLAEAEPSSRTRQPEDAVFQPRRYQTRADR